MSVYELFVVVHVSVLISEMNRELSDFTCAFPHHRLIYFDPLCFKASFITESATRPR